MIKLRLRLGYSHLPHILLSLQLSSGSSLMSLHFMFMGWAILSFHESSCLSLLITLLCALPELWITGGFKCQSDHDESVDEGNPSQPSPLVVVPLQNFSVSSPLYIFHSFAALCEDDP